MKTLIFFALLLSARSSLASFIPENDLSIPVDAKSKGGISEEEFNEIIDLAEAHYRPIFAAIPAELSVERLWKNGKVNAEAEQFGEKWVVRMFGGMARYRLMNRDGFTIVLCHEIGHHIGGAPKFGQEKLWASNEGQADYFATTKCLRRLWQGQDHAAAIAGMKVTPYMQELCHGDLLCLREILASKTVGDFLAFLKKHSVVWLDRPVEGQVKETYDYHNSPQCRLDTWVQGTLCQRDFREDFENDSEVTGACHANRGDVVGMRPGCWFKAAN